MVTFGARKLQNRSVAFTTVAINDNDCREMTPCSQV